MFLGAEASKFGSTCWSLFHFYLFLKVNNSIPNSKHLQKQPWNSLLEKVILYKMLVYNVAVKKFIFGKDGGL